jgi:hypothetical protein
MKRALAVCTVLAVLGFSAFGIGTFSGKWETSMCFLPSFSLSYTKLTINYTDFGWTFSSISKFDGTGYVYQKFGASGAFGPFTVKGNMWFDPVAVKYMASDLSTTMDFAGIALGLTARHWVYPYWGGTGYTYGPDDAWYPDTNPCPDQTTGDAGLQYILTAKVDPISIKLRFADCCTGTAFQDLLVKVTGIGLCCGISLNSELYFTKAGFNYVKFSGINIPLCCGVSLDIAVKFTVDSKTVSVTPKFAGIGEACFTVYGVPTGDFALPYISWTGIEIKAWAIECKLGDCNYIKFVTAADAGWYNSNVESVFKTNVTCDSTTCALNEYEYINLGFCGAGCCGGKYTVDLSVFFGSGSEAGLFDITRLAGKMSIPVMANLTADVSFSVYAKCACPPSLCMGWTFTF